jgi:hypothetical protein
VSVCGTDTIPTPYEAFLGSVGSVSLRGEAPPHHLSELTASRIFLGSPPTGLDQHVRQLAHLPFCVPPSVIAREWWYRNINLFSIGYACRPHLRIRLTLGGLTFPRNPWAYGERVFHPLYRYLCQHKHFQFVHRSLRSGFDLQWNAPLPRPPCGGHPQLRQCA